MTQSKSEIITIITPPASAPANSLSSSLGSRLLACTERSNYITLALSALRVDFRVLRFYCLLLKPWVVSLCLYLWSAPYESGLCLRSSGRVLLMASKSQLVIKGDGAFAPRLWTSCRRHANSVSVPAGFCIQMIFCVCFMFYFLNCVLCFFVKHF